MLQNVSGIPQGLEGDIKLDSLRIFMKDNQVDIAALMELNTAQDLLHYNHCLPAKTRGWWELAHWSRNTINVTHTKRFINQEGWQSLSQMKQLTKQTKQEMMAQVLDNGAGLVFGVK